MKMGKKNGRPHCYLEVKIQPSASRSEFAGFWGEYPKIRVAAAPVDGAANKELISFLAGRLGLAKRDVEIVAGHSSRIKRLRLSGISREQVQTVLYKEEKDR